MAAVTSPELAPLVTILSREQSIYQKLLELAADERQAIVDGKLPALKAVLLRKQDILERLAALEDRRIGWLRRYARKRRLGVGTLTLAAIIDASSADDRHVLTRLHRGLRRRIAQLKEMNEVTQSLLGKVLGSIDASLRFLLADDGSAPTYGAKGRIQSTVAGRQLLECKA